MENQIKIFFRNFLKQKTTGLLSIGGLSLGIAIALLFGWWSINEMNFDTFNRDADNIYRVSREGFINNETVKIGTVFAPLAREAKARFPEITDAIKIASRGKSRFQIGDIVNYEENIYLADSNFFEFFDYKIISGNKDLCFDGPDKIVLTQSFSNKYFPNENPIGQTVQIYGREWEVGGIMENAPTNSHLQFDALCNMAGLPRFDNNPWGNSDMYMTYLKIHETINAETFASKVTDMALEQFPPYAQVDIHHILQPLKDIHFDTENFRFDNAKKSDKRFVMIFIFMAIAILIIACINFTNLFISTSFLRAKTVGVKKTNGAAKKSLIAEFFIETSIYVWVSLLLGVLLAILFLPVFNNLADSAISFDFTSPVFYLLLFIIGVVTVLMAGTFPAFYITKFNPVATLKGTFNGKNISVLQKGLVILQFAASIVLLITVVSIKKQVHYIQNVDLGFNKSNIVYVDAIGDFSESYESVKHDLEQHPGIIEVTAKNCIPSDWNNGNPVSTQETRENPFIMEICRIEDNYLDLMEIDVVAGENIAKFHDSLNYCMLNEQAVKVLGLSDPIGKEIMRFDQTFVVKGVLENVKTKSLHGKVDPQVYHKMPEMYEGDVVLIKVGADTKNAIKAIKEKWQQVNPDYPFEYHFLDDTYDALYHNEKRAGKIVTSGMIIALFITMIGLFAMARYATERRTKEIGVRKVNGAKVAEILLLLNKDFLKWVLIALIVATPVSWYVVSGWLKNFAYRTTLSWWIFAMAGLIAIIIAIVTVSWQTYSAAKRNPIKALRYE